MDSSVLLYSLTRRPGLNKTFVSITRFKAPSSLCMSVLDIHISLCFHKSATPQSHLMQWISSFQALSSYVCVCTCVGLPLNVGSLSFVLYANLSLNCNGPTKYLPKQGFLGMDKSFVSITGFEAPSSVCVCGSSILCWAFHWCGSFTVCACVGPLSLCSLRKSVCLLRILTRQARMLSTNNLIVAEHLFIISS